MKIFNLKSKGNTALVVALMIVLPLFLFVAGGAGQVQQGTLDWGLGLKKMKTGEYVSFSAPVHTKSGEEFRIEIAPKADCFCYIVAEIIEENNEEVEVIFAGPMKKVSDPLKDFWQSSPLVPTGSRGSISFYVVMSLQEQKVLAERISAYNANTGVIQRRALMNEVVSLRSQVSQYKETPEKPILMGGAARTASENPGVEFSGLSTYVKTISIEH